MVKGHSPFPPTILDDSLRTLTNLVDTGVVDGLRWRLDRPVRRRRSIVMRMEAFSEGSQPVAFAYVKRYTFDYEGSEGEREHIYAMLGHATELDTALAGHLAHDPVDLPRVLAIDRERYCLVTLGVRGEALGRGWRHSAHLAKYRQGLFQRFRLLGRLLWKIERCTTGSVALEPQDLLWRIEQRRRWAAGALPSRLAERVTAVAHEWSCPALRDGAGSFVHGDLSVTNVLLNHSGVGLIDFAWKPVVPGFDLACLFTRLSYERRGVPLLTRRLMASLVGGYTDASTRETMPYGFYFYRLAFLLDQILGKRPRVARRALREIEDLVS